jgi:POT family proton-dependent oligopeptide transporter
MSLYSHLLKQPRSFWNLAFGELTVTFSYYGTQTILVLYLLRTFSLSHADSYVLYGAYAALAYSLPILGGVIADRWLGSKITVILGCGLNVLGNLMLMIGHHYLFCLGLAASLMGASLCKGNLSQLVGTLYPDSSTQKEAGFTMLYLFINIGGVLGPLVYGVVVYAIGWRWGFLCSALGLSIAGVWFIANRHQRVFQDSKKLLPSGMKLLLYLGIGAICLAISSVFYIPQISNMLIISVFLISITYLVVVILKYQGIERRHLMALAVLSFFGMFFFAASLQVGSTITLFIQSAIQAGTLQFQLPASVFSTLYPLFVLVLAPFFTYLWHTLKTKNISISMPAKLCIAMVLAGVGIGIFALTAVTQFMIPGILLGNILLSAGEIVLTPAIYMAVSDLAPAGLKGTMMGCWLLFIALGGYLSGVLANASHLIEHATIFHHNQFLAQFTFITCFTFIVALLLLLLVPKLTRMIQA